MSSRNRIESEPSHGEEGVRVSTSVSWSDDLVRRLTMLFVVAVLVNYPWERLQSQLYTDPGGASIPWWLCLVASLVDGLFILLIFGIGLIAFGRRMWFEQPGVGGYCVMLASGFAISVGIEWMTVYLLQWWTYSDRMPLVPGLGVGAPPLAQMLVLPPFIFYLAATWNRRIQGSGPQTVAN